MSGRRAIFSTAFAASVIYAVGWQSPVSAIPPILPPALDAMHSGAIATRWEMDYETSRLDDSPTVYASVESNELIAGSYGLGRGRVVMTLRCREKTTSMIFGWPLFLSTGAMQVDWRLDKKPVRRFYWRISTDFKAIGAWSGGESIPLIKELMNASMLTIRLTPYGEQPREVTFDVSDNADAIDAVRKACKW